jgi:hypothetical protein
MGHPPGCLLSVYAFAHSLSLVIGSFRCIVSRRIDRRPVGTLASGHPERRTISKFSRFAYAMVCVAKSRFLPQAAKTSFPSRRQSSKPPFYARVANRTAKLSNVNCG